MKFVALTLITSCISVASISVSAEEQPTPADNVDSVRASISAAEKQKREVLGQLFKLNQSIKEIARRRANLNQKFMQQDATVRSLAQEVDALKQKSQAHKEMLNQRLRRLYQTRGQKDFQWLFSAQSPLEVEKHHRYLKLMIDSDHQHLRTYLGDLAELRRKRDQLRGKVARLLQMQKEVQAEEVLLARDQKQKSMLMNELKRTTHAELSRLESLRKTQGDAASQLAFFERKGSLESPVEGKLAREYGTFVDPQYQFRLMHKGLFYSAKPRSPVKAVFEGKVALSENLPGLGRTVILDHGDNYYTVYAFAGKLAVRAGTKVKEGEILALSGPASPLFGPGLYFEIRHFAEAIDPRQWIKEPSIKTADTN